MFKLIINILIIITLLFSVLVITSKNPVVSVVFLISVFVSAALILIFIGAEFIGIAYILVYVGAVAILFLFVIMMINIQLGDILETGKQYTKSIPLAICMGSLLTYAFISLLNIYIPFFGAKGSINTIWGTEILLNGANKINSYLIDITPLLLENKINITSSVFITANPNIPDINFFYTSQVEAIGHSIYTYGAINLIITSFILLLAMIAALYLSRNNS